MGSWGYEANENDTASDFLGDVVGSMYKQAFEVLYDEESDPNDHRAACYLLHNMGKSELFSEYLDSVIVNLALKRLYKITNNEEWIEEWDEPGNILASLKEEIENMKVLKEKMGKD